MKKKIAYFIIAMAPGIVSISCNRNTSNNPKTVAESHNDDKFNNAGEERNAQYLVDQYSSGLYELKSAEVAKTRAVHKDVKQLAEKIADSHKKLNEEIKKLASSQQVTLPDDLSPNQHDKLQNMMEKKGNDFDKEFVDQMVSFHKDDITNLEKASRTEKDAALKTFATNTLPVIRGHLDSATTLQDRLKK